MDEIEYKDLTSKLNVSVAQLFKESDHILEQIEDGIGSRRIACPIVGYQGVPGAYGEQAAINYFKGDWRRCIPHESFEDVFDALEKGEIDYGVVPIENSTAGEVVDTYDLIKKYNLFIVGEVNVKVEHNLLGVSGSRLEDIQQVYSHPQALAQSKVFLKEHKNITPVPYINTATACQYVGQLKDITKAAIGSKRAGEIYGLEVIAENIHFNKNNVTRFIVLSKKMNIEKDSNKISIVFLTEHVSGALYKVLGHFAYNGLNLLKIQSRPCLEHKWEYYFFADLEGNLEDANVLVALARIEEETRYLKVLGNYKQAD